jgi:hypothetical protein
MPPQPPQSSNCDDGRPVRRLGKKQPTTEISTKTSESRMQCSIHYNVRWSSPLSSSACCLQPEEPQQWHSPAANPSLMGKRRGKLGRNEHLPPFFFPTSGTRKECCRNYPPNFTLPVTRPPQMWVVAANPLHANPQRASSFGRRILPHSRPARQTARTISAGAIGPQKEVRPRATRKLKEGES